MLFLSGIDKVEKNGVVVLGGAFFCWKCVVPWSWISLELPVILLHCKINLIRVHQKCFKNSSVRWSWNESCTPSTCGPPIMCLLVRSSEFGRSCDSLQCWRGFSIFRLIRTFRKVVNLLYTKKRIHKKELAEKSQQNKRSFQAIIITTVLL